MEGVLSDPDKDPDLTVATSMSDDTTKPISSTEIYDLSLDSSSICLSKVSYLFLKTVFVKLNAKIISNKKRSKSKRSLRKGDQIAAITL